MDPKILRVRVEAFSLLTSTRRLNIRPTKSFAYQCPLMVPPGRPPKLYIGGRRKLNGDRYWRAEEMLDDRVGRGHSDMSTMPLQLKYLILQAIQF